jgi:hypothetical protein
MNGQTTTFMSTPAAKSLECGEGSPVQAKFQVRALQ